MVRLGQDRLVINLMLPLHINNILVNETGINHISSLQLQIVSETGVNWLRGGTVSESQGAPFFLIVG